MNVKRELLSTFMDHWREHQMICDMLSQVLGQRNIRITCHNVDHTAV